VKRYVVDKEGIALPLDPLSPVPSPDEGTIVDLADDRAEEWERFCADAAKWRSFWTARVKTAKAKVPASRPARRLALVR
jgi:hypothetical protein